MTTIGKFHMTEDGPVVSGATLKHIGGNQFYAMAHAKVRDGRPNTDVFYYEGQPVWVCNVEPYEVPIHNGFGNESRWLVDSVYAQSNDVDGLEELGVTLSPLATITPRQIREVIVEMSGVHGAACDGTFDEEDAEDCFSVGWQHIYTSTMRGKTLANGGFSLLDSKRQAQAAKWIGKFVGASNALEIMIAIDDFRKGLSGWKMRQIVPDCYHDLVVPVMTKFSDTDYDIWRLMVELGRMDREGHVARWHLLNAIADHHTKLTKEGYIK